MNWHEYFTYDDATGNLIWKERDSSRFLSEWDRRVWNANFANKRAGYAAGRYMRVSVENVRFSVHRIVWEMHNGPIPDGMEVDHIDCDSKNNRRQNLRACSRAQNTRNTRRSKNNTSGIKGVSWYKPRSKWRVQTHVNGKVTHIGYFIDKQEAAKAYEAAVVEQAGQFARVA